jgi:hypothetical protein
MQAQQTLHQKMVAVVGAPAGRALRGGKQSWSQDQLVRYAAHVKANEQQHAQEVDALVVALAGLDMAGRDDYLAAAMAAMGLGGQGGQGGGRRRHRSRRHRSRKHRKARKTNKRRHH